MEEDKSKDCLVYPGEGLTSYRACTDIHLRNTLATLLPGLTPPWLPGPLGEVTLQALQTANLTGNVEQYSNLYSGKERSSCKLPCSTFRAEARLMVGQVGGVTGVALEFLPRVEVTTTELVRPLFSALLADLGGSVGLWLGLGVLQAIQLGAACLRNLPGTVFRIQH